MSTNAMHNGHKIGDIGVSKSGVQRVKDAEVTD